jgi:hypothetical protein
MKCESCGNELVGGAIICRVCKHNNALRGMKQVRPRRTGDLLENPPRPARDTRPTASHTTSPMTELPRIVPRKDADDNLIRFPAGTNRQAANPQPSTQSQTSIGNESDGDLPPWRAQLKEKVRQVREKRSGELTPIPAAATDEPDEAESDPNPIVEAALKRIRWAEHPPAVKTTISARRQGAGAAAAAKLPQPEPEVQPRPEPRPQPRPEPRIVAPRPGQTNTQSGARASNRAANQRAGHPPVVRVETRTLTPKINRPGAYEDKARSETKSSPSPESRILTPREQPRITAELRREPQAAPGYVERDPAPAIKADKHVDTEIIEVAQLPEPLPLPEAAPASLWVRTLAWACDLEVIALAYLLIFGSFATLNTSLSRESMFIMLVLLATITFVYQLSMLLVAGRTTGMALLGLTLLNTDDDSLPVTRRQKMLRAWAATISFLCPPLNYLVMQLNIFQRSLPDLVSGTTAAKQ